MILSRFASACPPTPAKLYQQRVYSEAFNGLSLGRYVGVSVFYGEIIGGQNVRNAFPCSNRTPQT